MTLILRYFDPKFGFGEWSRLTNPDVYHIDLQKKNVSITRLWNEQKTNWWNKRFFVQMISLAQYKNLKPHHNPEMWVASKLTQRVLTDT